MVRSVPLDSIQRLPKLSFVDRSWLLFGAFRTSHLGSVEKAHFGRPWS
jgi:hypothetical protein